MNKIIVGSRIFAVLIAAGSLHAQYGPVILAIPGFTSPDGGRPAPAFAVDQLNSRTSKLAGNVGVTCDAYENVFWMLRPGARQLVSENFDAALAALKGRGYKISDPYGRFTPQISIRVYRIKGNGRDFAAAVTEDDKMLTYLFCSAKGSVRGLDKRLVVRWPHA